LIPYQRTMSVVLLCFVVLLAQNPESQAQLQRGISSYQEGNYTEAIEILEHEKQTSPDSSAVEFFLGMSHKQLGDHDRALAHLRRSIQLEPRIKESLVELIDVLYKLYTPAHAEEAFSLIEIAEKENIYPGKIAFLKGMFLQQQEKYEDAISSFETAAHRNEALRQAADFQIARCYTKKQDLKRARLRLEAAIQQDPTTDLAGFARQYVELIEKRMEAERPIRLTVGLYGQYDTNVVLKPIDDALAPDVTDEGSRAFMGSVRLDYIPRLQGDWLFNAYYAGSGVFHDKFSKSHDSISNSIYLAPGYRIKNGAFNLTMRYDHALVRDPSYKGYMGAFTIAPMLRRVLTPTQILELSAGWRRSSYYRSVFLRDEDRDATGFVGYLSWIWLYKKDGFLNARYSFATDNTDGANWDRCSHAFSLNLGIPVAEKVLLQLSGMAAFDLYDNQHTIFQVTRNDSRYQGSIGIDWNAFRNFHVIGQFSAIRNDSNIAIYDYDREVYTLGIEYRY
jgi:tetratricopeptide (TPR) repeat protein